MARAGGDRTATAAAVGVGVGVGGLVDGVVFHQVLQWHHLASGVLPPDGIEALRRNVFWDGVFHVATTALLLVALALLLRVRGRHAGSATDGRSVVGHALVGWGAFGVGDQIVFHELLGLHDIREGVAHAWAYNWGFFAVSVGLIGAGWWLRRAAPAAATPRRDARGRGGQG